MAGNSILRLDGDFSPGKTYLVKGSTLRQWQEALLADRVVVGPGLRESGMGPTGRVISVAASPAAGATATHPFQMRWTREGDPLQTRLTVSYGMVLLPSVADDIDGNVIFTAVSLDPRMADGMSLADHPAGGPIGHEVLAPNVDYGVWIKLPLSSAIGGHAFNPDVPRPAPKDLTRLEGQFYEFLAFGPHTDLVPPEIHLSTSALTAAAAPTLIAAHSNTNFYYVGRATVDTDGVPSIQQWLRSDLTVPSWSSPMNFRIYPGENDLSLHDGLVVYVDP